MNAANDVATTAAAAAADILIIFKWGVFDSSA